MRRSLIVLALLALPLTAQAAWVCADNGTPVEVSDTELEFWPDAVATPEEVVCVPMVIIDDATGLPYVDAPYEAPAEIPVEDQIGPAAHVVIEDGVEVWYLDTDPIEDTLIGPK